MKVGDIVEYIDDWKKDRQWYVYSLHKGDLCTIVLLRDGEYKSERNGETRFNTNIVNLPIEKIRIIKEK